MSIWFSRIYASQEVAKLEHSDSSVRIKALHVLGNLNAKELAQHQTALAARLEDPDSGVRSAAVNILGKITASQSACAPNIVPDKDRPGSTLRQVRTRLLSV